MSGREPPRRIAEGREAELYAWGNGRVLRLLRDPDAQERNEQQRAAIRAAALAGVRVPAVYDAVSFQGRPGLVMERIDGPDLLTLIGRKPWRVFWVARRCGEVHARLHEAEAPPTVPPVRQRLQRAIPSSGRVPADIAGFALDTLAGLPDGAILLHGDFHPGNLMLDRKTPVVIDWTGVTRGHPDADLARTLLLLRLGEPPPGTSLLLRLVALFGRRLLIGGYIRAYRRMRAFDPESVARWEVVQAAERLNQGIEAERRPLLRLLERLGRKMAMGEG